MIYQKFLEQTLQEASEIVNHMFGKVSGRIKEHDARQVLTEADLAVGKFIIGAIEKQYPAHNIIDEESGVKDKKSEYTWVIDPIDGTANFAVGIPLYGIMIGLLKDNEPIAGGISLPYFGTMYTAEKNSGAFLGKKIIKMSDGNSLVNKVFFYSLIRPDNEKNFTENDARIVNELLKLFPLIGSSLSVYDSAMLAEGRAVGMLHKVSKIWDNVAQHILIEEAGGIYTDFYGKPMDYSNPLTRIQQNYTYCAALPKVHEKLQKIIHKIDSGSSSG